MNFIDFFCGIGTIRMGFEQAGHRCVYSVEWDKHKRRIYSVIFGKEPEGRDIRECRGTELPRANCWCFGAPCQDFSIAGERKGLEGDRSSLVREVFRLVREVEEEHRPEWLLYENVKGMLSSNKGLDYLEILIEMDSLGYDIEWQLLNTKHFEVPQNRERVFTLGHLRRCGGRKVFPIRGSNNEIALKQLISGRDAERVYDSSGLGRTLKAEGGGQGAKTGLYLVNRVYGEWKVRNDNITTCLDAGYHQFPDNHGARTGVLDVRACLTPDRMEKRQNGRRFKEDGEPMFTLTKQDVHGVLITQKKITQTTDIANTLTARNPSTSRGNFTPITAIREGARIRRLTPRECWRLQGVSEGTINQVIAAGISDTQMYRGAGDACTVNVIYEIAKRMS